jgi:hypothetical protein
VVSCSLRRIAGWKVYMTERKVNEYTNRLYKIDGSERLITQKILLTFFQMYIIILK